jgi:hypothetical protein
MNLGNDVVWPRNGLKNTPTGGLKTYMPDFSDLARRPGIDLRPRRTQPE